MNDNQRLLWIELLRIVSMIMVVILHICLQGGVLDSLDVGSTSYILGWLLESLCYCAVNCYAMITGYVMYKPDKKFNYSRIIPLWLQVCLYCTCIFLLFAHFSPQSIDSSVLTCFTPVFSNTYWYFTSYFGMFFFIPFINILINNLDKKQFTQLTVIMFILLSFMPFTFAHKVDPFLTGNGYSTLWLVILYFAGAYIKRFESDFNVKKYIWLILYIISSLIPCLSSVFVDIISVNTLNNVPDYNLGGCTYNYTSPFTVIAAVSLFMTFKDTKIKNPFACGVINFFAPASFGVYLIHVHPLVFDNVMQDAFKFIAQLTPAAIIPAIIGCSLLVFIVLAAIDRIRILIFKLLKVKENSDSFLNFIIGKLQTMQLK